ncbi:MAG: stimulus-sensing domain-containing protein [Brevundimonas sp.]|uniref:stimulus-sensing domain-containing protein n=1 Tax=Brevundimonas sp. TaxID=1871086 RepID=UPI00271A37C4|nr:stimulus-sensing domain-containing protein [Brevundimonas sp.]MDO9606896.1 stimulus-sensing domain-containing protein [Brevundimonas sp.]
MASATATAKADHPVGREPDEEPVRRPRFRFGGSRLGGFILALNLLSLLILFGGALVLNEWRQGLIQARQESLTVQAELLGNVLGELGISRGVPTPELDVGEASKWLRDNFVPNGQRVRLYDINGLPVIDSYEVTENIPGQVLPPARPAGTPLSGDVAEKTLRDAEHKKAVEAEVAAEVERALAGEPQTTVRRNESGDRVVSVSIPIRHVRQVLGVLTLEAGNVDEILDDQRRALVPFALVALAVNLLASLLLHLFVARPVLRLAAAADQVRLQRARAISLPDLEERKDEIGDLARSLESMTDTLSTRMDAIERFAADVSHEIKNPLTSIRSALETLPLVKTDAQREKLTNLLQQDVRRLDRLITDISNASRLDAELSRDRPRAIELNRLLTDIVGVYDTTARPDDIPVRFEPPTQGLRVAGRDGPLGQVFRNLIDNARSFSPAGGEVRVVLEEVEGDLPIRIRVEDQGPGIPPENLETVFERFYTSRPKGAAFGSNSGLGLSIVRQIVEAHGGRVTADNRIDANGQVIGARFEIGLPSASAPGRRS